MATDYIKHVGDVTIEFVEIISNTGKVYDISKYVASISVYEDIFSPFISGNILIYDAQDLVNLLPLIGEEVLRFNITTPSFTDKKYSIGGNFSIYKLSEREEVSDKSIAYTLNFVSLESIVDLNKKISATLDGSCSDIAAKLLKTNVGLETKKPTNIEATPNGTKFISNFWSPTKCLNYTASNATNANGSPSYLFFENRYGFNFVSLESLFVNPVYQNFIGDNYANSEANKNPDEMYKRIIDISMPVAFDYIENISSGMYSSKLYTYDLITKKVASRNFNVLEAFPKEKHLNNNPTASKSVLAKSNAAISYEYKMYGNFNNYGDVTNTSTQQKRISLLKQLSTSKVNIIVPGRTDYTVGQKVYLKLFKKSQAVEGDVYSSEEDKMFTGNYLISSIHHSVTRQRHECYVELVRDSIQMDVNK